MARFVHVGLGLAAAVVAAAGAETQPARRICRPGPPRAPAGDSNSSVLVIGDSISLMQMVYLARDLCPRPAHNCTATVAHGPYSGDGGALDTKYAMDTDVRMSNAGAGPPWHNLSSYERFGDGCLNGTFLRTTQQEPASYDVITFNYGVHDVLYNDKYNEEWVPLELYRENLRSIKRTLQATGAKVLFHSSTPLGFNLTNNQRILDYNAVAKEVMAESPQAAYHDLYHVIIDVCGNPPYSAPSYPDAGNCSIAEYNSPHYKREGWILLAEASAAAIRKLLAEGEQAKPPPRSKSASPVQCPAPAQGQEQTACPAESTCMMNAYSSSGFGCCMGYGRKAMQCADKVHCCPEGWSCSKSCHLGGCFCEQLTDDASELAV